MPPRAAAGWHLHKRNTAARAATAWTVLATMGIAAPLLLLSLMMILQPAYADGAASSKGGPRKSGNAAAVPPPPPPVGQDFELQTKAGVYNPSLVVY
ncbi:hypothetical protein MNEG_11690, partial [Monoraphidium neglectum]